VPLPAEIRGSAIHDSRRPRPHHLPRRAARSPIAGFELEHQVDPVPQQADNPPDARRPLRPYSTDNQRPTSIEDQLRLGHGPPRSPSELDDVVEYTDPEISAALPVESAPGSRRPHRPMRAPAGCSSSSSKPSIASRATWSTRSACAAPQFIGVG